jgi:hypothetical protein
MVSARLPGTPGTTGLAPHPAKMPAQAPEGSTLLSLAIDENGSHAARSFEPQDHEPAEPKRAGRERSGMSHARSSKPHREFALLRPFERTHRAAIQQQHAPADGERVESDGCETERAKHEPRQCDRAPQRRANQEQPESPGHGQTPRRNDFNSAGNSPAWLGTTPRVGDPRGHRPR